MRSETEEMTEDHSATNGMLTITQLAIREGLGYQVARERALRGDYGRVERIGGRLYVMPVRDTEGAA